MSGTIRIVAATLVAFPIAARAQHAHHHMADSVPTVPHQMTMKPLGGGYTLMGMAQIFPAATSGTFRRGDGRARAGGFVATQPVVMANLSSPGSRVVLRTTLDFEGLTMSGGEFSLGGWGEGFLDSRHPHTLVHEAMVSINLWRAPLGGTGSIAFGKGLVPYGTDDPMSRPVLKYPTNHHLAQILERWTLNGQYLTAGGWGLEAAVFGGDEPDTPYDFSNISSFGDSWAARVSKRFGPRTAGPFAAWELSGSVARVAEAHHQSTQVTTLYHAALRHSRRYGFGTLSTLVEASASRPSDGTGHHAFLAEGQLELGGRRQHQPYWRVELSTRPEYARLGGPGDPDFFRYDHETHAIGSTRWTIATFGYGHSVTPLPVSARPFIEVQYHRVAGGRGGIRPDVLFGKTSFWSVSTGARVFLGGGPMRMGSYGVLDPMSRATR